MYKFKFFYKDGTCKIRNVSVSKPELLYYDFDGLMDWDEYYKLFDKKMTLKELLNLAYEIYKSIEKPYYRIEIINDVTNEIVDYIDESKANPKKDKC